MSSQPQCKCGDYVLHGPCLCDVCAGVLRERVKELEAELKRTHNEALDCAYDQWARGEVLKAYNAKLIAVVEACREVRGALDHWVLDPIWEALDALDREGEEKVGYVSQRPMYYSCNNSPTGCDRDTHGMCAYHDAMEGK